MTSELYIVLLVSLLDLATGGPAIPAPMRFNGQGTFKARADDDSDDSDIEDSDDEM